MIKSTIKNRLPNLYSSYQFYKIKKINAESIRKYKSMDASEYPDELCRLYKERTGHDLNLVHPQRFTEKLQWRKLYDDRTEMALLSDKYAVRGWVKERIGEEYLIPLLGVWDSFDRIDFSELPETFVLKTNNASGTVMIVNDKSKVNFRAARRQFDYWMTFPFGLLSGLELHYLDIKPKIIAEKNMLGESVDDLPDYKFFCFDGRVYCSYVTKNYMKHVDVQMGFFDRDFKLMKAYRTDYAPMTEQLEQPKNYDKMVEIAERLSQGFSHVRVDLYNINGEIYFGEMTFTTNSGYTQFVPDEFDYELGRQWILPAENK